MSTTTLPPLAERVAAGAALLDRHQPGWATQVDPTLLDMQDPRADVLGQLYGSFDTGVRQLIPAPLGDLEDDWICDHAFDIDDAQLVRPDGPVAAYQELTCAWRLELARRRKGGDQG